MTSDEWESSCSVLEMLEAIPTSRFHYQLLSFTVSICQRMSHLLPRESLAALTVVERYLAGQATEAEVQAANTMAADGCRKARIKVTFKPVRIHSRERAAMIVQAATTLEAWQAAKDAALACVDLLEVDPVRLLRNSLGNPFTDDKK